MKPFSLALLLFACLGAQQSAASELRVAVASNFAPLMAGLAADFEAVSGHRIKLSNASSGKLYAQIRNGAPFDVFLSADVERPQLLDEQGLVVAGTRFTYAKGRLLLWVPGADAGDDCLEALSAAPAGRIAIANPELAPYGRAARETLQHFALWQALQGHLAFGENIGQTFVFVHAGAARAGLVAKAQAHSSKLPMSGCRWLVPASAHQPIEQQAVLLRESPAGRELLAFLRSEPVLEALTAAGYDRP